MTHGRGLRGGLLSMAVLLATACTGGGQRGEGSETASPSPSPQPVSSARLEGTWDVTLIVREVEGLEDREVGDEFERTYVFVPDCAEGPCDGTLVREGGLGVFEHEFTYEEGRYLVEEENDLACGTETVTEDLRMELQVTEAEEVGGELVATTLEGTLTGTGRASQAAERLGCVDYSDVHELAGTLAS